MLGSSGLTDLHEESRHLFNKKAWVGTNLGNQTGPGCRAGFSLPPSLLGFLGSCGVATQSQELGFAAQGGTAQKGCPATLAPAKR